MPNLPFDDAAKILKGLLKKSNKGFKDASKLKSTKKLRDVPSKGKSLPRNAKPQNPKNIKSQPAATPKPPRRKMATPPRPKKDYIPKGSTLPKRESIQRAAEKRANQMLRRSGDMRPNANPQPSSGMKPVGRPAPSSQDVSGTRTKGMGKDKGKRIKGQYEANRDVAEIAADRAKIGKGQPRPKRPKPPKSGGTGGVTAKPKPKPKKPSGGASKNVPSRQKMDVGSELKRLRSNINNAKSAAEVAKAKQARIDFLKKRGMALK